MTISNPSVRSGPYTPDGVARMFGFNFLALSAGELQVTQVVNGVESPVSGWSAIVSGEGGTVIFSAAPAAGSGQLYINAAPSFTQTVTGTTALLPSTVVAALDRLTQMVLVLQQRVPTQAQFNSQIATYLASIGVLVADQGSGT